MNAFGVDECCQQPPHTSLDLNCDYAKCDYSENNKKVRQSDSL